MKYHVLTLFPEMIENTVNTSITGRALKSGKISLHTVNIRDFADTFCGSTPVLTAIRPLATRWRFSPWIGMAH